MKTDKENQKEILIDLMNSKTIEEGAEEYANANKFWSDRPFEFNRDKHAYIQGANHQKQIDESLAVEFVCWIDKNRKLYQDIILVEELFDIFKKEKGL